jgi:threonine dehydrogenase-like Zn-dependent dehydrogenase
VRSDRVRSTCSAAAVYHGLRDIRVEDVDVPGIAEDESLVRVRACGICGSDLHI